jgi:flagellar M-ring protein FliF
MNQKIQGIFSSLTERWSQLSFNQRILLGTMVLALVLSTFFVFQRTNDDYDILYDNMSLPDAAAAVEKLKGMHEPYKLANGGRSILVPRNKKNELVLATANELTGENTVNLAKIPPVLQGEVQKEWIKKLNTQEITSILKSIQGIKNAQVVISQPDHSVFEEDNQPVTASVMLIVEPGFRLQEEQVKVIKNLVAHAVPGLTAENVAIADNSGNPLVGPGSVIKSGQTDADIRQKAYEDKITKKVLAILSPVVGKENAVVSVSAVLNFDQAESEINRVIPSGGTADNPTGLAVSQQTDIEEYNGGGKPKGEGGPVGVESNAAPQYQGTTANKDKDSTYKHSKTTTNYTNSEERKKVIYAPGTVERLTVAVVLNKVLTAKETSEITQLVESAAGIDRSRGDSVEIKGFQFSAPPVDKEKELADAAAAAQRQSFYLQLASMGAMVLLGLAALFIFYNMFKKPAEGELVEEEPEEYNYIEEAVPPPPLLEETPIPALEAKLDPEIEHMKASINNLINEDPAEAARVLVTYMKEL